ncbi:DUF3986 family protein [Dyadobacter sp. CY356]|uniref:DUF3986 family protein n=1 Tax=Dyadobacter sp. CY356 TaxID=2906442 RepID=UPI0038D474BA
MKSWRLYVKINRYGKARGFNRNPAFNHSGTQIFSITSHDIDTAKIAQLLVITYAHIYVNTAIYTW